MTETSSTKVSRRSSALSKRSLTFRETMKDFPYWQLFIVSLIRFSEPISFTSLFPYVYYMVRDFKIAPTEQDIPKYTAYLASSFSLSQFLFAVRWGKLSDKIGRKKVLLCGLIGTSISLISFGFSTNFYMALAARSLAGCLNGNISVLRTVIGEIAVERKHQATAFSLLPLLFNLGSTIGPAIGGSSLLTRPNPKSPYEAEFIRSTSSSSIYESFITKHPYALSNIVVSLFLWFSCICGFFFLEETHDHLRLNKDYGLELGDWFLYKLFGIIPPLRPWQSHFPSYVKLQNEESTPLIDSSSVHSQPLSDAVDSLSSNVLDEDEDDVASVHPFMSRSMSRAIVRTYSQSNDEEDFYNEDLYKGAFTVAVVQAIVANFLISLHSTVYSEFLPVFLASRFKPSHLKFPFKIGGGFGMDTNSIGVLFSLTGIMGMIIVLLVFPYIDRKLGTLGGFRFSVSILPLVYFLVPWTIFTIHDLNPIFKSWLTPVLLYILTSIKTLATATGMPQIMILNHRSAKKHHRAYVNSTTISITALARFVGPLVFGWLMSLGDSYDKAWLMWWILSLISLMGFFQSLSMKDYDEDAH